MRYRKSKHSPILLLFYSATPFLIGLKFSYFPIAPILSKEPRTLLLRSNHLMINTTRSSKQTSSCSIILFGQDDGTYLASGDTRNWPSSLSVFSHHSQIEVGEYTHFQIRLGITISIAIKGLLAKILVLDFSQQIRSL